MDIKLLRDTFKWQDPVQGCSFFKRKVASLLFSHTESSAGFEDYVCKLFKTPFAWELHMNEFESVLTTSLYSTAHQHFLLLDIIYVVCCTFTAHHYHKALHPLST